MIDSSVLTKKGTNALFPLVRVVSGVMGQGIWRMKVGVMGYCEGEPQRYIPL